ncbi:hypothetical protein TNCV_2689921 [Trichonephila clavipes]|uniref:Uncharacterized protein n=1 Tax=Trichonephila clavipes TaxID=2585209 RepID=A0A8X6VYP2_TRICX|nr:hypothetical protein TNCV_2689921 [Trichonephila clavipes]
MQVTVRFCSVPPPFRGRKPWGGQGPPTSLPLPPTIREDLWLDGYLEYSYAAKALYIYKHPCLLRDSNPVPTVSQSIPVGRLKVQDSKCNKEFQIWWTEKHGIISKRDRVVCVLCSKTVTCRTSSLKTAF